MRTNSLLGAAIAVALLAVAPASEAATYRDVAAAVEVRIERGRATVTYVDPVCGLRTASPTKLNRGAFRRREATVCTVSPVASLSSSVMLAGRVTRAGVRGRIGTKPFLARHGAPPPTRSRRCAIRGVTLAETEQVRAFAEDDRTILCRRSDGWALQIARIFWDSDHYYATGISARHITAVGSRIAWVRTPFDSARSKYGQDPGFEDDIVVRDVVTGHVTQVGAGVVAVEALVLRDDGDVAWAGAAAAPSFFDIAVQTVRGGQVVTLDRGPIDPASLRTDGAGFAWDRRPPAMPAV